MFYAPDLAVIAGGFMFGIGAAVNGGRSFGTLIRFAAGDLRSPALLEWPSGYGYSAICSYRRTHFLRV
jgi:uncharacterized membrane protein YedE/YeeE